MWHRRDLIFSAYKVSKIRGLGEIMKAEIKRNEKREERIVMEIVVDAYDSGERAMGWYYYLENRLEFPFTATCVAKRAISPLQIKDEVDVMGLADERECGHEMFVTIQWDKEGLAVPLEQLQPITDTDKQTIQAVEDWHYWRKMGYSF
jgi:Cu2+-containing amine oxidase